MTFWFRIEPQITLKPRITIKNIPEERLEKIGKRALNNFVFHLGMMEIPSYWKATCSPEIAVQAGYLDKDQAKWWHDLLIKGMGQYFFENKIDWRDKDFLKISVNPGIAAPAQETTDIELKEGHLIPIGGGKDSVVTLNLLKEAGGRINCFLLNPSRASKKVVRIAGIKSPVVVERKIDSQLLELNKQGYLNGHTPFTAMLSFLASFCATLFDYQNVAFSNEKSADEGNILYLNKVINHQWAKTSEFEKMFKVYCQKYLAKNLNYGSFLRKYTELQIAKMFSRYPKYFGAFSSCNIGQKTGEAWCCACPKCLFSYLILYPFLKEKDMLKIFSQDLFANKKLLPLLRDILGQGKQKPFECVGTYKEAQEALKLGIIKAKKAGKLPYLLLQYETE